MMFYPKDNGSHREFDSSISYNSRYIRPVIPVTKTYNRDFESSKVEKYVGESPCQTQIIMSLKPGEFVKQNQIICLKGMSFLTA